MHNDEDSFFEIVSYIGFVPFVFTRMDRILVGMKGLGFIKLVYLELLTFMYFANALVIQRKRR